MLDKNIRAVWIERLSPAFRNIHIILKFTYKWVGCCTGMKKDLVLNIYIQLCLTPSPPAVKTQ
jgi:hypothetical protein